MQDSYIYSHYQLGCLIVEIMRQSPIINLEIDVYKDEFYFYPTFMDKDIQIVEWVECKDEYLNFSYHDKDKNLLNKQMNFMDVEKKIYQQIPLLHELPFLNYLSSIIKKDKEGNAFYRFRKFYLATDINDFWGNSVKSYFLHKKLEHELVLQDEIKATKI